MTRSDLIAIARAIEKTGRTLAAGGAYRPETALLVSSMITFGAALRVELGDGEKTP